MDFLGQVGGALWDPWLLGLFLAAGGYFSLRTGFFQLFGLRLWLRTSIGGMLRRKQGGKRGGVTQLQAMATALAATIGTGSIAGVATAIFFGGPGAVFWMWVSAFLGMMTGCMEKMLAVRYRRRGPEGFVGGPMCYMEDGLGWSGMAKLFSAALILQTLTGGSMVQANSIAAVLYSSFGWNKAAVGLVIAAVVGVVVLGGIRRIGRVSELLVPLMAVLFIGGGAAVLFAHRAAVPAVLSDVVHYAFQPKAILGGYSMGTALRYGVARGVFTNEAGMGSSAVAHAAADVDEPAEQGMWGIFEVFLATLVICTVTALVILTSGLYTPEGALRVIRLGEVPDSMTGAPLTAAAFATVLGRGGELLVAVCLVMFAFTSLLGAGFYGQRGVEGLSGGRRSLLAYRALFLVSMFAGSVGEVTSVWQLTDLCNGLLALPNLIALLALSHRALELFRDYEKRHRR